MNQNALFPSFFAFPQNCIFTLPYQSTLKLKDLKNYSVECLETLHTYSSTIILKFYGRIWLSYHYLSCFFFNFQTQLPGKNAIFVISEIQVHIIFIKIKSYQKPDVHDSLLGICLSVSQFLDLYTQHSFRILHFCKGYPLFMNRFYRTYYSLWY